MSIKDYRLKTSLINVHYSHKPYVETFGQIDLYAIEDIEKKVTD
jgi:hypothetical protein